MEKRELIHAVNTFMEESQSEGNGHYNSVAVESRKGERDQRFSEDETLR